MRLLIVKSCSPIGSPIKEATGNKPRAAIVGEGMNHHEDLPAEPEPIEPRRWLRNLWIILVVLAVLIAGGMGYLFVMIVLACVAGVIYLIWEVPRVLRDQSSR